MKTWEGREVWLHTLSPERDGSKWLVSSRLSSGRTALIPNELEVIGKAFRPVLELCREQHYIAPDEKQPYFRSPSRRYRTCPSIQLLQVSNWNIVELQSILLAIYCSSFQNGKSSKVTASFTVFWWSVQIAGLREILPHTLFRCVIPVALYIYIYIYIYIWHAYSISYLIL